MMKTTLKYFIASVAGLILLVLTASAQEPDRDGERITVRVDGLSCPFCAYGLEKNLKSLEGVSNLDIKVNDGIVTFKVRPGVTVTEDQLKKAVKNAGFTLRNIKREPLRTSPIKKKEDAEYRAKGRSDTLSEARPQFKVDETGGRTEQSSGFAGGRKSQ